MSATSTGRRRAVALFGSLSLAVSVSCGSSGGEDLFGGGATGSGGSPAGQGGGGGTTSEGGRGGTGNGGQGLATGGSSGGSMASGGANSGGVSAGGTAGVGGLGGAGDSAGVGGGGGVGGGACGPQDDEVCDGVDNDCNDEVDEEACPAKCIGFVARGGRYMTCNTSTGQAKASSMCEEQGMRLAWLDSAEENAAVTAAILALPGTAPALLFIGASDAEEEGSWHWVGGSAFWEGEADGAPVGGAFANWSEGRPNDSGTQDCAALIVDMPADGEPGQWNDTGCTSLRGALCESP